MPSEDTLGKTFGMSRMTARNALNLLKEHRIVRRTNGGTFVDGGPVAEHIKDSIRDWGKPDEADGISNSPAGGKLVPEQYHQRVLASVQANDMSVRSESVESRYREQLIPSTAPEVPSMADESGPSFGLQVNRLAIGTFATRVIRQALDVDRNGNHKTPNVFSIKDDERAISKIVALRENLFAALSKLNPLRIDQITVPIAQIDLDEFPRKFESKEPVIVVGEANTDRSSQLVFETCRRLAGLGVPTFVLLALDNEEHSNQPELGDIANSCNMLIPVDVSSLVLDRETLAVDEWSRRVQEIFKYLVESLVSCLSPLDMESKSSSYESIVFRDFLGARSNSANAWVAGVGETPDANDIVKACSDALDMAERQNVSIDLSQRILLEFGPELTMAQVRTGVQVFQERLNDQADVNFAFRGYRTMESESALSRVVIFADRQ